MNTTNKPGLSAGNYAAVNGLNMYYKIHGVGKPRVLLHGGVGATEMFDEILPRLGQGRQVIVVDLQAHGRTADIDRPLSYETMADDIGALTRRPFHHERAFWYKIGLARDRTMSVSARLSRGRRSTSDRVSICFHLPN